MPVTRFANSAVAPSAPAPASAYTPAAPTHAAMPYAGAVGHGTTRLMSRPPAGNAMFVPGTPPPRGETAGANKGRISVRY
jgi:hypothetical protein